VKYTRAKTQFLPKGTTNIRRFFSAETASA
jgi:hypothetical protein